MSYNKTSSLPSSAAAAPAGASPTPPSVAALRQEIKKLKRALDDKDIELRRAIEDKDEAEASLNDALSGRGAFDSGEAVLPSEAMAKLKLERDQAISERDQAIAGKIQSEEEFTEFLKIFSIIRQYMEENNLPQRLSNLKRLEKNVQTYRQVMQVRHARQKENFDKLQSFLVDELPWLITDKLRPLASDMVSDDRNELIPDQEISIGERSLPSDLGSQVLHGPLGGEFPLPSSRYRTEDTGSSGALPGLHQPPRREELPLPMPSSELSGVELQDIPTTPSLFAADPKHPQDSRQESTTAFKEPEMTVKQGKQPEKRPLISEQPNQRTSPPSSAFHDSTKWEEQQDTKSSSNIAATRPKQRSLQELIARMNAEADAEAKQSAQDALQGPYAGLVAGGMRSQSMSDELRRKMDADAMEFWEREKAAFFAREAAREQKKKKEKAEEEKAEGTLERTSNNPGRKRRTQDQQQLEMDRPAEKRRKG